MDWTIIWTFFWIIFFLHHFKGGESTPLLLRGGGMKSISIERGVGGRVLLLGDG